MQASLKLLETMYTKNFKLLKNSAELVVSFLNFYFRSSLLKQKKKKRRFNYFNLYRNVTRYLTTRKININVHNFPKTRKNLATHEQFHGGL